MSTPNSRHDSDKRVIRTKKSIKNALFKIMESKDISSITISELTNEANVNRRTFYTHYRNITDILDEVEGELVTALKALGDKYDPNDFEKSTYNLFIGLDKLISEDFDYYFHLVRVDMRGMLMSRLKTVIKSTAEDILSHITKTKGSNAASVAAFIAGGFFNLYIEWHYNNNGMTLEEAARVASRMVGICIKNAEPVIE